MKLTFPIACILSDFAAIKAESIGVPMVIAFADENANLIHFGRMQGALPASGDIAIKKALTSAALRLSTQAVGQLAQPGKELYGIQHVMSGSAVLFGGGLPLSYGERILGAVGVSGGTTKEDVAVAEAVRDMLGQMVRIRDQLAPILPAGFRNIKNIHDFKRKIASVLEQTSEIFIPDWIGIIAGAVILAAQD